MNTSILDVSARTEIGKQHAKSMRREGTIPAVFYGAGKKAVSLAVDPKKLIEAIDTGSGENTLITLVSKGNKDIDQKVVLLKARQLNPVTKNLVHVDFYEVAMDKKITVEIPVIPLGKAIGIEDGGTLQMVRKEVEVECLPNNIPEKIEVDVSPLRIGDSIHIGDLTPPEGVTFIHETNFTIINLAAPTKEEEVKPEEALAEGEEGAVPAEGEAKTDDKAKEGDKKAPDAAKPEKKSEKK